MIWDEHIILIGHTINCFGASNKVIGNTGSNSTREAVHATEQEFAVGMHTALPMSPTIIYNVPSRTGQDIPLPVIHSIANSPNFAGIKECVGHNRVKEYTKKGLTCGVETMMNVMIQDGTMMLHELFQLLPIWFRD